MSTLISNQDGNITGSNVFSTVENGTGAVKITKTNIVTILSTSYLYSAAFTDTNSNVADGILLFMRSTGSTGTVTVAYSQDNGTTDTRNLTVNASDLPLDYSWVFFKFGSTLTLDGGTDNKIGIKVSADNNGVQAYYDTTTNNWCRMVRLTTTATATTGDVLYIVGEHTGAGATTSRVITMNDTASTDFGNGIAGNANNGIEVCDAGTLSFGTSESTNYTLKVSGSINVWKNGTFNIGTTGTPIPRNSTAKLQFDCGANVDFGLIIQNGGTFNAQGLSRTSGKNVVSCKLSANTVDNTVSQVNFSASGSTLTGNTYYSSSSAALEPNAIALVATKLTDSTSSGVHAIGQTSPTSITNTTQVYTAWITAGTGTNKRYVRMQVAEALLSPVNGFYADIDLQSGTIGTCTALGNGTATSSSITPLGTGYICTIIGKASSGAQTPICGLLACNTSGGVTYTGDATHCFSFFGTALFTENSLHSSDLTVDTDTGWLSGDLIAVASTTRTYNECELRALSSNATSDTLSVAQVLNNNHSGTSPTQAEVILLTRNVKICGASTSLQAYVNFAASSTVDLDWTEFYWLGSSTSGKYGLEANTTSAGSLSIQYCSIHSNFVSNSYGFYITSASGSYTFSYNVVYAISYQSFYSNAASSGTPVISNNIFMFTVGTSQTTLYIRDVGCTFQNNTICGGGGANFLESGATVGTFSGNVFHANSTGLTFSNSIYGTIENCVFYRNSTRGMQLSSPAYSLLITGCDVFGNQNGFDTTNSGKIIFEDCMFAGDTTYSQTSGFSDYSTPTTLSEVKFINCDFGVATGIYVAHTTGDITLAQPTIGKIEMTNCRLASSTEVAYQYNLFGDESMISSQKHDQTAGNHKTWKQQGTITIDTSIYRTLSPSMRMTPISVASTTNKFESGSFKVNVGNGQTCTPSVYVRESVIGDGYDYSGNRIRLILKRNDAMGITSDTIIATATASSEGGWEALSGTTSAVTDDGVLEFVVDCDYGTANSWINVDDFTATVA